MGLRRALRALSRPYRSTGVLAACVLATLVDSGTVPAFTCDCLRVAGVFISTCVRLHLREQCLRSKLTSFARAEHVLRLRPISGNMDVNTLASKRSELIRYAEIVRMRCVIHNNSTCVCLRLPVAAITQKRKLRPVAGFTSSARWS